MKESHVWKMIVDARVRPGAIVHGGTMFGRATIMRIYHEWLAEKQEKSKDGLMRCIPDALSRDDEMDFKRYFLAQHP